MALWFCLLAVAAGCGQPGVKDLLEGDRRLHEGQYHEAIKPLQRATTLLPNNALAWNHLGFAHHHAGFPDDADAAYRRALTLNPNLTAARWNLGCLCLELNRPADAAQHFASVVMLDSKNPAHHLMHAIALVRAGKADEAERLFKQFLAARGAQPDALNGLAIAQWQRGRHQDAAATLHNLLQTNPTHRPATLNLAIIYYHQPAAKPQARQLLQRYLAFSPRPPFYDQAAQLAKRLDDELRQPPPPANALILPPVTNPPPAAVIRPAVAETQAPPARPLAVVTSPPAPSRLSLRTNAAAIPPIATIRPPATAAVAVVTPAPPRPVQTNPAPDPPVPPPKAAQHRYQYLRPAAPAAGDRQAAWPHYQAGEAARRDKLWAEAVKNLEAAIKADPAFFEAYLGLGRAAYEAREHSKALAAYETALALQPDAASTRYNFALALQQAGFSADAAGEFERFYQAQPNEANGRLFVANLYLKELHDTARARVHFQRLVDLQPQHPQATAIREWLLRHP